MNQEITYCEELFPFLYADSSPFEETPQKIIWKYLKQNSFVLDSKGELQRRYANRVLELPDSDKKNVLKSFLDGLINQKGNLSHRYPIESKNNLINALCLFSKDKILFEIEKGLVGQMDLTSNSSIEIHDVNSFLSPEHNKRLKHLPTYYQLSTYNRYDIRKIFFPFLRNAKLIEIDDPYLPNHSASINFFKLAKAFRGIKTKLIFLDKKSYLKDTFENPKIRKDRYESFILKLDKLNRRGYCFDYRSRSQKGHRDRFILTERIQIILPGGFDCLNKYGYPSSAKGKVSDKKAISIEWRRLT